MLQVMAGSLISSLSSSLLLVALMIPFPPVTYSAPSATQCKTTFSKPPTFDDIIYYSDVVLLGDVLKRYNDTHNSKVYTVEIEVLCVYKGGPIPQRVNISNAGYYDDLCLVTEFPVGSTVIGYLKRKDNGKMFVPRFREHDEGYLDEIEISCGIVPELPEGVDESNRSDKCKVDPDYNYDSNCSPTIQQEVSVHAIDSPVPTHNDQPQPTNSRDADGNTKLMDDDVETKNSMQEGNDVEAEFNEEDPEDDGDDPDETDAAVEELGDAANSFLPLCLATALSCLTAILLAVS